MKSVIATFVLLFTVSLGFSQDKKAAQKPRIVEVSCGQCKFAMTGKKGCDLAVRMDGNAYFVEGAKMDQFGDAHGENGMCNTVRKAEVTGEVKDNKFIATSFKLLPVEGHKHDPHDGHKH